MFCTKLVTFSKLHLIQTLRGSCEHNSNPFFLTPRKSILLVKRSEETAGGLTPFQHLFLILLQELSKNLLLWTPINQRLQDRQRLAL